MHASVADPQCVSAANSSSQWLKENFGFFSRFASVLDFYKLHRNFSGVNENQPLDFNTLTPTPISPVLLLRWPPTSSPFASSAAGGSSSPDSQTAGGDAAAASSDPARETRRHRLGDGLPAGIPQGWEADSSPASPDPAGGGGNDIVTANLSFFNVTLGHHLLRSNCRSVPRAASTNKCEFDCIAHCLTQTTRFPSRHEDLSLKEGWQYALNTAICSGKISLRVIVEVKVLQSDGSSHQNIIW